MQTDKRKITLIGAGRVATNLALALRECYEISCVYSRTEKSASTLAAIVPAFWTTRLKSISCDSDLYIISVVDDALPEVIAGMPDVGQSVVVHTAGSVPLSVFGNRFAHYGVFYPMQTFSKERMVDFHHVPFFLEASDDGSLSILQDVAGCLSEHVINLSSADRRYLHLAAVFASNFANHCYAMAWRIASDHNIPFSVMQSLIEETALKLRDADPIECQTGPAVRFDSKILQSQQQLLSDDDRMREIYKLMSEDIQAYKEQYDKL